MGNDYKFGSGFAGTSYGAGKANLAYEGKKAYDRWEDEYVKAQERLLKKSSWGSGAGLLFAIGSGLLTGGMSTAAQMAIAGGATIAGRTTGNVLAGKKIDMKKPKGLLFYDRKYKESKREMDKGYRRLHESAVSSALTNAMTAGIASQFRGAKEAGDMTKAFQVDPRFATAEQYRDLTTIGSISQPSALKFGEISREISAILYGGL